MHDVALNFLVSIRQVFTSPDALETSVAIADNHFNQTSSRKHFDWIAYFFEIYMKPMNSLNTTYMKVCATSQYLPYSYSKLLL